MSNIDQLELEVSKLNLGPDDVVVVKTPTRLKEEQARVLHEKLREIIGADRKIMVLAWGVDVAAVCEEALQREYDRMAWDFKKAIAAVRCE
jgi:hypothetical protein